MIPHRRNDFLSAIAGAVLLLLAACGSGKTTPIPPPHPINTGNDAGPTANTDFTNDPCATRLQDISGSLLEYYAINRQMPVELEDIRSMAEIDEPLVFTCPETGLPYIYNAQGLHRPGHPNYIVVYDAVAHGGMRNCIFMTISGDKHVPQMQVLAVPENLFLMYR